MLKKQIFFYLCTILLLGMGVGACRTGNSAVSHKNVYLEKVKIAEIQFDYLQAKGKVHYQDHRQDFASTVELRIKKDSAIWLSFRPALNVEVARVLITQDSLLFLDRLNDNDAAYSFRELQQMLRVAIDYEVLESALVGNLLKKNGKVVGHSLKDSMMTLEQEEKNLRISTEVTPQAKIRAVQLQEKATQSTGEVSYGQFSPVQTAVFPFIVTALLRYRGEDGNLKTANIDIKYTKVDFPIQRLRFPF